MNLSCRRIETVKDSDYPCVEMVVETRYAKIVVKAAFGGDGDIERVYVLDRWDNTFRDVTAIDEALRLDFPEIFKYATEAYETRLGDQA